MSWFSLFLVIVVIVVAILAILKARTQGGAGDEVWPFYAKRPLSQPEQILYFRLVQALPDHIILAQVQLSRLLGVKKGNNYQAWLNRINRMSADFVVCNKDSSIVAVIELDDATHQRDDRQAADTKKDKALGSAGVHVVRWHVKEIPDLAAIRSAIIPSPAFDRDAVIGASPFEYGSEATQSHFDTSRLSRKGKTVMSIEALSITVVAAIVGCGLLWYNYTSMNPSPPPMASQLPQPTSTVPASMSPQQEMLESNRKQNVADDIFNKQYKEPAGCDNWQSDKQMVDCVNQRMRAKSKFLDAHPEFQ